MIIYLHFNLHFNHMNAINRETEGEHFKFTKKKVTQPRVTKTRTHTHGTTKTPDKQRL